MSSYQRKLQIVVSYWNTVIFITVEILHSQWHPVVAEEDRKLLLPGPGPASYHWHGRLLFYYLHLKLALSGVHLPRRRPLGSGNASKTAKVCFLLSHAFFAETYEENPCYDRPLQINSFLIKALFFTYEICKSVYCILYNDCKFFYFRFYEEALLPEIVYPLYGKSLKASHIREASYVKKKWGKQWCLFNSSA